MIPCIVRGERKLALRQPSRVDNLVAGLDLLRSRELTSCEQAASERTVTTIWIPSSSLSAYDLDSSCHSSAL